MVPAFGDVAPLVDSIQIHDGFALTLTEGIAADLANEVPIHVEQADGRVQPVSENLVALPSKACACQNRRASAEGRRATLRVDFCAAGT